MPSSPNHLTEHLTARLRNPRTMHAARRHYASDLSYGRYQIPPPWSARPAAVIVLLCPGDDDWHLPLTVRCSHLPAHGGQISLPGGLVEPGESSQAAALRELNEELGVNPDAVQILGHLSDLYLWASNFVVTPWVATIDSVPEWIPSPDEVAEVLELPWQHLLDEENNRANMRQVRGVTFRSPYVALGDHQVWGATCMMLGELRALTQS